MRFGGHQTFYIREGWLFKGLELLMERPDDLVSEFSFDHLGVGKNMAISIQHWLQATGLAKRVGKLEGKRTKLLEPTELAQAVWANDRYFATPDTWWLLHVNLLNARDHAESWFWLFNHFNVDRFDRELCVKRMMRYAVNDLPGNTPSQKTIERDLSCLFNTYAVEVPARTADPEEDISCPFRELDLMVHYRDSGHIQMQRRRRTVEPSIFMYTLELALRRSELDDEAEQKDTETDIRFFDLARLENNPMRAFLLSTDALFETLVEIERNHPELGIRVVGLAGERQVRIRRRDPLAWVEHLYRTGSQVA